MRSLMYANPRLYIFSLRMIHGKTLERRYEEILRIAGKGSIFEPGCGPGILGRYAGKERYSGMDLNEKFVRYARKKGYKCMVGNIFWDDFPYADIGVAVDILHHITPREKELIEKMRERYRTVIVIEPVRAFNIPLPLPIRRFWDALFGDSDGINSLDNRRKWHFTEDALMKYMKELGAYRTYTLGKDVVAIFRGRGDRDISERQPEATSPDCRG